MRAPYLASAFLLLALPSSGEVWPGPGRSLPAAVEGLYTSVGTVGFVSYKDLDTSETILSYRHYLPDSVIDNEKPIRLQPFLQRVSYVEGSLTLGSDDSNILMARGRYHLEQVGMSVGGRLGYGATPDFLPRGAIGAEAVYYFPGKHILALELELTRDSVEAEGGGPAPRPIVKVNTDTISVGARYVVRLPKPLEFLEIAAGYRHSDTEGAVVEGIVVEARFFFNKNLFAGADLLTGISKEGHFFTGSGAIGLSVGYAARENFHAEFGFGRDDELGGEYSRFEVGLRF
jgi:hypothetical protein